jgi:hypothetical protein
VAEEGRVEEAPSSECASTNAAAGEWSRRPSCTPSPPSRRAGTRRPSPASAPLHGGTGDGLLPDRRRPDPGPRARPLPDALILQDATHLHHVDVFSQRAPVGRPRPGQLRPYVRGARHRRRGRPAAPAASGDRAGHRALLEHPSCPVPTQRWSAPSPPLPAWCRSLPWSTPSDRGSTVRSPTATSPPRRRGTRSCCPTWEGRSHPATTVCPGSRHPGPAPHGDLQRPPGLAPEARRVPGSRPATREPELTVISHAR